MQQDSAEVLINVLSQLELGLQKPKAETEEPSANLIEELFSCNFRQQLFYESSGGTMEAQTPVDSVFVHPIVGVEEEGKDLYDCLAELYLGGADIEYEGKKGYMMDLMDGFPPFLYIQMRVSRFFIHVLVAKHPFRDLNSISPLGGNASSIPISHSTRPSRWIGS